MKKTPILFVILLLVIHSPGAFTQSSSSASASATIINPVSLATVRDMDFGKVSAGGSPGTVILAPTAASTRSVTGGVTLPSGSSTMQSAKFLLSGEDGKAYSIVLPSSITLSNGSQTMTVDTFTSTPSSSGLLTSGTQTLYVGATLNVNANQEAGEYRSTVDFEITVNYN